MPRLVKCSGILSVGKVIIISTKQQALVSLADMRTCRYWWPFQSTKSPAPRKPKSARACWGHCPGEDGRAHRDQDALHDSERNAGSAFAGLPRINRYSIEYAADREPAPLKSGICRWTNPEAQTVC